MDLLTIASGAAAITITCVRVSTVLFTWIEEVKDVDGNIRAFFAEVHTLSAVLDAVKSFSQETSVNEISPRQETKPFWALVHKTLDDCRMAIGQLDRVLTDIAARRKLGQVITNYVLNLKSSKIELLRQQIQSYTTVLQMALQMISMNLLIHNAVTSTTATTLLSSRMDVLLRFIQRAESSLSQQRSIQSTIRGGQQPNENEVGFERLKDCTEMAQRVYSSAATVVADSQSTRGGIRESYISFFASDYGGISDSRRMGIENWIPGTSIADDFERTATPLAVVTTPSSVTTPFSTSSTSNVGSDTAPTTLTGDGNSHIEETQSLHSNSSQDVELFWVFYRRAGDMYESRRYAEAERCYLKVLDRSTRLQVAFDRNDVLVKLGLACLEQRKWVEAQNYFGMVPSGSERLLENLIQAGQKKLDVHDREGACVLFERVLAMSTGLPLQTRRDLHSKAGIAYFLQEKWAEAKEHFLAVEDVENDLRYFEAQLYLAKIHFQEADLDNAETRCLIASDGRWRILGRSHPSYHESIALLADIYMAKGDPDEAAGYATLLPEGYRSLHKRETTLSALCLKYGAQVTRMKECLLPGRPLGEVPLQEIFNDFDNAATTLEAYLRASYSADLLAHASSQADSAQLWAQILQDLVERKSHCRSSSIAERRLFTILHLFALLGLEAETRIWLSVSPWHAFLKDEQDNTPFELAVSAGHITLASHFLDIPDFRTEARRVHQESLLDSSLAASSIEPLNFLISHDLIDLTLRYGEQRDTPLMVACRRSNVLAARLFLSRSSLSVREKNEARETALIIAAGRGCSEAVELLLSQRNIDVNAISAGSASALTISIKGGYEKVVDLLLSEPRLHPRSLGLGLIAATEVNWANVVRKILRTGRIEQSSGNDALRLAAARGNVEIVEALLEFDVNSLDGIGERLLQAAIRRGDDGVVQALVKAETLDINHDPGIDSVEEVPPLPALHLAATLGSAKMVNLLLDSATLNVNQLDSLGLSALHSAILHSQFPVVEALLACPRVEINLPTRNRIKTPLHLAVKMRSEQMVGMLLASPNLRPNETDDSSRTPLMMTMEPRFYSAPVVHALLSDARVDVDFANAHGDTALHHAASHLNLDVTHDLLQHSEVRTDIRNGAGLTARRIAEKGRGPNARALAKVLSRHGTSRELIRWFS